MLYVLTAVILLLLTFFWQGRTEKGRVTSGAAEAAQNGEKMRLALTFDDGPNRVYTKELLDGLKERDIKASFFLMGKSIVGNEELVKRMHDEGHLIGNHTYNHVQLNKLPDTQACDEILKTNNLIYEITGEYPLYIRPPFGVWVEGLDCHVTMLPVFWNVDPLDWNTKNVDQVVRKVEQNAEDGDIILMHDNYDSSVKAALRIVDDMMKEGYEFVTVDKLILDG